MARSDLHTAFGGMVLGMSLPLFALGVMLQAGGAPTLGLELSALDLMLPLVSAMSALMLSLSGSLLLWGHKLEQPPRRVVTQRRAAGHPVRAVFQLPTGAGQRAAQREWAPPRRGVALELTPIRRAPALAAHVVKLRARPRNGAAQSLRR